jgi:hypothetical protein
MKLKLNAVLLAVVALALSAGVCSAESVTVSSTTATQIVAGNTGRYLLCVQNAGTNEAYFSKYSSSATATSGMILKSSATWSQPVCLQEFRGALYGKAAAGATSDIRYTETLR